MNNQMCYNGFMTKKEKIVGLTCEFAGQVSALRLEYPFYIYNPLEYAWRMHEAYLSLSVGENQDVLLLGMNPGPYGMCQTGVPFGDRVSVKEYLRLDEEIDRPEKECPKRPIEGLSVSRVEVSGRRLWGTISSLWERDSFFSFATVFNYCPLCFLDEEGRNVTPDKLSANDRKVLFDTCDTYLAEVIDTVRPSILVGVGTFSSARLGRFGTDVRTLPHPSPRNRNAKAFYDGGQAKEFFNGLYDDTCLRKGKHRT